MRQLEVRVERLAKKLKEEKTVKLANASVPVNDVEIQKRPISISVLTLGERQVTQTLYKQLVEEDVVDECTGKIKGPILGWVNLHSDCWYRNDEHLHAVWEDNGEIKRAFVRLPWTKKHPAYKTYSTWEEAHGEKPYFDKMISKYHSIKEDDYELRQKLEQEIALLWNNWEESYKAIKEAGQLFIAVSGVWK
jgi:hypothetical protein